MVPADATLAMACTEVEDCDDGLFCNGMERCNGEFGCEAGRSTCQPNETCDEATRSCIPQQVVVADAGTPTWTSPFDDEIGDSDADTTQVACYPPPTHCGAVESGYPASTRGRILMLGEGDFALRFACMLRQAGFALTRLLEETDLDASIDLSRYAAIVTLDGMQWGSDRLSSVGEQMIVDYVNAGGGFVAVEWALWEGYPILSSILPTTYSGWTSGTRTHSVVASAHPIAAGLPSTYPVTYHGYSYGALVPGAEAVIDDEEGHAAVAARAIGSGRVAWFGAANNYNCFDWLANPPLNRAFVRAVGWAAQEGAMPENDGAELGRVCSCAGP